MWLSDSFTPLDDETWDWLWVYDKMSNARTFYFWIGSFLSFHERERERERERENICVGFIYNKYTFVGLVGFWVSTREFCRISRLLSFHERDIFVVHIHCMIISRVHCMIISRMDGNSPYELFAFTMRKTLKFSVKCINIFFLKLLCCLDSVYFIFSSS